LKCPRCDVCSGGGSPAHVAPDDLKPFLFREISELKGRFSPHVSIRLKRISGARSALVKERGESKVLEVVIYPVRTTFGNVPDTFRSGQRGGVSAFFKSREKTKKIISPLAKLKQTLEPRVFSLLPGDAEWDRLSRIGKYGIRTASQKSGRVNRATET